MKNIFFRNVSVGRILLAIFSILIITLFAIRFFESQRLERNESLVTELTEKSIYQENLLINMRKGSDYVHVNLLRFLFYADKKEKEQAENRMLAEITKNEKNFTGFKNSISDSREQSLFDTLVMRRHEYAKNRSALIQLVKAGKEKEALQFNSKLLFNSYEIFQQTNTLLADYVRQRDIKSVEQITAEFSSYEKARTWINYILLLILVAVGLMIARVLKKLKTSNLLLSESEQKYRALVERTTEIIQTANQRGQLIAVNNAFKEKLEYKENEITTLTILDILAPESKSQYKPNPLKSEYGEVITGIRKVLQSKTGKKIIVEGNIILNYKNETFESSTAFFNDVTEKIMAEKALVDSEEKYRLLVNSAPVPMWVFNPDTLKFVSVNPAAIKHYGYTEDEFLSMTILDIRPLEEIDKVKTALNLPRTSQFSFAGNYLHIKKSGELIDVDIFSSDVFYNNKKNRMVMAVDVTEKNLFEQKLIRAIIKTQEEERYEIGAELHDNVCQILAVTQMTMGSIKNSISPSV